MRDELPKATHCRRWGMVWRKEFVSGAILDGIKIWDRLEFVDRWHCAQWLKGVRRNIRQGSLEWRFSGRPTTAKVIEPTLTEVCKDILTVAYPLGRWNDGKPMRPRSSENGPWSGKGDR